MKTLDACVTSVVLPYALRVALRALKSNPFGFVAGMKLKDDASSIQPDSSYTYAMPIPASKIVIPAIKIVIPAQAGIQRLVAR